VAKKLVTNKLSSNWLLFLAACTAFIAVSYFFIKTYPDFVLSPGQKVTPSSTQNSDLAVYEDDSNWKTYKNSDYNFELRYPMGYEVLDDLSGWPKSIAIISRINVQSYDLVIEIWNDISFQHKYSLSPTRYLDKQVNNRHIVLINLNGSNEVDHILSTFRFTN